MPKVIESKEVEYYNLDVAAILTPGQSKPLGVMGEPQSLQRK